MPPGALKCRNCGSNEIEEDNARGDAVCTNCGSVLEDSLIVSEVQFEEVGRGSAAIGQFVSADSAGGATNFGYGKFQVGSCTESREVTIKKAKKEISHLCYQLQLNQHCIDTALNFFKMALTRHLTRGRKSSHIYAACVYITCRTEGTSHLLIDISDVQQICSYELGRTYLKLSNALCINIPSVDPCLYIMRFSNKLQFGGKTHEVSMTALRIVQRMKKDSIHSGRRPTGLCGAALLIAARMHDFNRTIMDIVNTVKIHGTTVRKRLTEFAETPSSTLTLEEFMSVDLEAEQDPPAFKSARKKDRDRIKTIEEQELTDLQKEIDAFLEQDIEKMQKNTLKRFNGLKNNLKSDDFEEVEATTFIEESNIEILEKVIKDQSEESKVDENSQKILIEGLKPDIEAMCRLSASEIEETKANNLTDESKELNWDSDDDEELNYYILTHEEAERKHKMWKDLNAEYLEEVKKKEERLVKEREEGKPEKKKRKPRKKIIGPSTTVGEAIEKMLQEKKISSKINYDILRTLTEGTASTTEQAQSKESSSILIDESDGPPAKTVKKELGLSVLANSILKDTKIEAKEKGTLQSDKYVDVDAEADGEADGEVDIDGDLDVEQNTEQDKEYTSLKDMLNTGEEEDLFAYEEDFL